jgi:hypothetical protein
MGAASAACGSCAVSRLCAGRTVLKCHDSVRSVIFAGECVGSAAQSAASGTNKDRTKRALASLPNPVCTVPRVVCIVVLLLLLEQAVGNLVLGHFLLVDDCIFRADPRKAITD